MAAVFEDNAIVYVKGREKRMVVEFASGRWAHVQYIEILDTVYDMKSLTNLDVPNTMRCGQHVKNCALQNVLKI